MASSPSIFWIIRYPTSGSPKQTIAKFDTAGDTIIPDPVYNYSEFEIQSVSGRSSLSSTIDHSGMSEEEKQLLRMVYPVL